MSVDPLAFLDEPEVEGQENSDPLAFLDIPHKKRIPKAARIGAQALIGRGQVAAAPYEIAVAPLASKSAQHAEYRKNIFEDIERLEEQKQTGVFDEQDQELLDHLIDQIKNPEKAEKFVKTADIGLGGLAEKGAEKLGFDLKPEDLGEELARLGGGFLDPKKIASKLKDLPKLLSKEGREVYKSTKQAEKVASKLKSLSIAAKGHPEKEGLLNWSEKLGLSPEATTLLLQSKGKTDVLSKIAKGTKKYKGAVEELKTKLGNNYEALKQINGQGGFLNSKQTEALGDEFRKIVTDLEGTLIKGPDTKAAITALEEGLYKLETEGASIGDLVKTRQNLGQSINWNNVDPKGAILNEARGALLKAIEKTNPKIAKDLKMTDQNYAKYLKHAEQLDKKQATMKIHGIEIPSKDIALAAAAKFAFGASIPVVAKGLLAKEAIQRLATQLITNPKLQGIHKNLMKATLSGAKDKQKSILISMKRILKEDDPELYEDLDLGNQ